jgi:hypothetical protein
VPIAHIPHMQMGVPQNGFTGACGSQAARVSSAQMAPPDLLLQRLRLLLMMTLQRRHWFLKESA